MVKRYFLSFQRNIIFLAVLFAIYLTNFYSYLLFHTLIEFCCIIIAGCISIIAWNGRAIIHNNYLLFIGLALSFVSVLELMHTVTYSGMGIVAGYDANTPTQLWIAARYMASISFFCAPFFLNRKLHLPYVLSAYLLMTAIVLASIFYWRNFPTCFVIGTGLTPFKKISEYIISGVFLAAVPVLYSRRKHFEKDVFDLLIISIFFMIYTELALTFYNHVYGISNRIGHLLKIISYYFLYRAIVETSFHRPFAMLFSDLKLQETEQLAVQKNLEDVVAGKEAIFENLNEGLLISDAEGKILDINPKGLELFEINYSVPAGISQEDFFRDLEIRDLAGEPVPFGDWPLTRVLRGEKFSRYELTVNCISSGKKWICGFSGTPVYDKNRQFIMGVVILRDITTEKQYEKSLEDSHQLLETTAREQAEYIVRAKEALKLVIGERKQAEKIYRQVGDLVAYGVWILGLTGEIIYLSQSFLDMAGLTLEECRYTNWGGRMSEESVRQMLSSWRRTVAGGDNWDFEFAVKDRTGSEKTILSRGFPIRDTKGAIVYYGGINLDITERVVAEKKLEIYSKRLEEQNQELQNFAYVASHDLQEPLRKIQTFGNILRTRYDAQLDDRGKDYLIRMENAASRMRNLIRALLAYSRVATRQEPFERVDLDAVVREVLGDLESQIRKTGARIEVRGLSAIEADPHQIYQLFQNLISNAIKFNDKPAPEVGIRGTRIPFAGHRDGRSSGDAGLQIIIEDNGIGFEEKFADQIFLPFHRLHSTREYAGSGVGLSICKKIVERHNGSITAVSIPGRGARFIIELPVKQAIESQKNL